MGEQVFINLREHRLEAILRSGDPSKGGVVAHPHPLYGGSMQDRVVLSATTALDKSGWTSLRFNFRGVGQSTGRHDHGLGEQDDLAAAARFLLARGAATVQVIGYSFGAWVAAFAWPALNELELPPPILIAPPAAFMSFEQLPNETRIGLIICGEYDDIAPPHLAEELGRRLTVPKKPVIVPGTDHFFGGRGSEITRIIQEYLVTIG